MFAGLLNSLLHEYRSQRRLRFIGWVIVFGLALWLVGWISGGTPLLLRLVFWGVLGVGIVRYLQVHWQALKQKLLWRLRRRLIVAYTFIAVIPIVLILILARIGLSILSGQFAAYMVAAQLREDAIELEQLTRAVAHIAHQSREPTPEALLDYIEKLFVDELSQHAQSYPGLVVDVMVGDHHRTFSLEGKPLATSLTLPPWFKRNEFAGIVWDKGRISLRAVDRGDTSAGEFTVVLSQPFAPQLLDAVGRGVGPVSVLGGGGLPSVIGQSQSVQLPKEENFFDFIVGGVSELHPIIWGGKQEHELGHPIYVAVNTRIFSLNRRIHATLGGVYSLVAIAFVVVAVIFLLIEIAALVIGTHLTRSITTTVDKLYKATERVKAGDFSHRIHMPAHDQLSSLGEAFDSMTASIEHLLSEAQEKMRLERDIEFAREVQRNLFPRTTPKVSGLELYGICKPARFVSGDYYDFLGIDDDQVGLALVDVSGKGLSAALLMAAIQSALRAQFYDGMTKPGGLSPGSLPTSEVVKRLNRQMFDSTPSEQYASFFYAVYEANTRKLSYTNAGHPPPMLFRRGYIERLHTGGTLVGLFPNSAYERAEVVLHPGDLLLAYTDGITERENGAGEEFGESRLLKVVQDSLNSPPEVLADQVYRSLAGWTQSPEPQDDMTLLVIKAVE